MVPGNLLTCARMDSNTRESPAYYAMLGVTIALSLLAVVTLLPNPSASKPNVLGYKSVCSFAPAASALCGLLAGVTCTIRSRRFSRNASSARYRPLILPIGVGVLLVGIAAVFGAEFGAAQSHFESVIAKTEPNAESFTSLADGTRSATFSQGDVSATVELTARNGRISALRLKAGKNVDDALARRIFYEVMAASSAAVDAVSGATASRNVLLKAIEAAARPQQ
jgi:uncharacterized protein with FMN-binding domain